MTKEELLIENRKLKIKLQEMFELKRKLKESKDFNNDLIKANINLLNELEEYRKQ